MIHITTMRTRKIARTVSEEAPANRLTDQRRKKAKKNERLQEEEE
jgi:hypothetical protein